ncbi:hypothetical protein GCM10010428_70690 [Actinosynnema pretiosum subsp. pretiosum]
MSNQARVRIRAFGEHVVSLLKDWKVLAKLRCCPRRATMVVAAILVLRHIETRLQSRRKRFAVLLRAPLATPPLLSLYRDLRHHDENGPVTARVGQ